jgi:hypothetical protein
MLNLLFGRIGQRLVIFYSIGYILANSGIELDDPRFWGSMILIIILEFLAYMHGMESGIDHVMSMNKLKIITLKDLMDAADQGKEIDEQDLKDIFKKDDDHDRK